MNFKENTIYDENSSNREYYQAELRQAQEEAARYSRLLIACGPSVVIPKGISVAGFPRKERNGASDRVFNWLNEAAKLSHGKSFKQMLEEAAENGKITTHIDKTLRSFNE